VVDVGISTSSGDVRCHGNSHDGNTKIAKNGILHPGSRIPDLVASRFIMEGPTYQWPTFFRACPSAKR
jgi:hypothetical protein